MAMSAVQQSFNKFDLLVLLCFTFSLIVLDEMFKDSVYLTRLTVDEMSSSFPEKHFSQQIDFGDVSCKL